ncbi:MAG TPA: iron chelate uptake ABC transporter family permease subunit, partial [Bdellovibrionota bacterium]|nr:iron chelate uptake ABC transporter family permease subunit [Bdellovibrionota bacterium]
LISGLIGTWLVLAIRRSSRIKEDAAIGIVLSVFFGIGIVLLTAIQHTGAGAQSGLDRFLFGQAASLIDRDVQVMLLLAAIILSLLAMFYKEFKILSFDRDFGQTLGLPMVLIEIFLTALIVVAVVIGIQTVGVVLMAAMLITPAVAARQWTDRLGLMLFLSGLFGMIGGVVGALLSGLSLRLPTGPLVVLTLTAIVVVSLFFAPRRGLIKMWVKFIKYKLKVRQENLLKDLHSLGREESQWFIPRSPKVIAGVRGNSLPLTRKTLRELRRLGLVEEKEEGWRLTSSGLDQSRHIVRYHRLWELYLSKRLELPSDHVHRDAEDMEHALTPEIVEMLEKELQHPKIDPHGSPIVSPKDIPDE